MLSFDLLKITFIVFSLLISFFDIRTGAVPRIAFVLAFPFFMMLKIHEAVHFSEPLIGLFTGIVIFALAYLLSNKRLGLADVWYSALMGLVLGLIGWYTAISVACITAAVFLLLSRQTQIPFIPFMAAGSCFQLTYFQISAIYDKISP